jgi:dolichol kinase
MNLFQTEFWSILCNIGLVAEMAILIYLSYPVLKRNFEENHHSKWNLAFALLTLAIFGVLLFLGLILPTVFDPLMYYPYNYYAFFGFFAWGLFTGLHIKFFEMVVKFKAKKKDMKPEELRVTGEFLYQSYQKFREEHPESLKYDIEFQRKLVHIISVLFLLPFLIGPTLYYFVYTYVYSPYPELYSPEILHNVYLPSSLQPLDIAIFSNTQTILVALLVAVVIQFVGEIFHNRAPDYFYPLRASFLRCLRKEELGSFGSHVSMTVGFLLSVVLIIYNISYEFYNHASNAIIATVLATIFADFAAAAFGRPWGKKKWRFNPRKSYVGTVAGVITCILVTFPFVGALGALITCIIFVLADVVLAKYHISDNFAFPVLCGFFLRLFIENLSLPLIIWNYF